MRFITNECEDCGACEAVCPANAIVVAGNTAYDLMDRKALIGIIEYKNGKIREQERINFNLKMEKQKMSLSEMLLLDHLESLYKNMLQAAQDEAYRRNSFSTPNERQVEACMPDKALKTKKILKEAGRL